jgi:hypothetical protein
MNGFPTVNKEQIISSINQFIAGDENILNLTLIVSIFATIVTPYLSESIVKIFHHDYFRILVLIAIIYLYTQKSTIVSIIVLIFFISSQMASVQKEHYDMIQNVQLENFSPSDPHMDETFNINPEYFRQPADAPLEGTGADVPEYHQDDYLLYNKAENMPPQQVISEPPAYQLDNVTGFSGEEQAPY